MPAVATAVVLAGGAGVRMGTDVPKALLPLAGRPMLAWSVVAMAAAPEVTRLVVVAPAGLEADVARALDGLAGVSAVVGGGSSRPRSVRAGLAAAPEEDGPVLVHDAARPLLTPALVAAVLAGLEGADGAIAAAPLADTLKRAGEDGAIACTVDREGLWRAETPQAFLLSTLRDAIARADAAGVLDLATDCASLVEAAGGRVRLVPSAEPNLKVTTPLDLAVAEVLLTAREALR
ncbi:MAG: 2-C-methyl-D-erythritol 4-phosphate cytidylyltransferase [Miltoncostaeaceae bacterium]|jgi:2-C-methyl-D-erythritol 4-phosphate cytidylyltransferase|nr:2-C-methyl-D-erythritol 4-phosphate cytidylyltransferase [Miltoncostaeaceae bacterium]